MSPSRQLPRDRQGRSSSQRRLDDRAARRPRVRHRRHHRVRRRLSVDQARRPLPDAARRPDNNTTEDEEGKKKPLFKRLSNISETALHDFIDITVFLCLGALLAATVRLWLTHERIEDLSKNYVRPCHRDHDGRRRHSLSVQRGGRLRGRQLYQAGPRRQALVPRAGADDRPQAVFHVHPGLQAAADLDDYLLCGSSGVRLLHGAARGIRARLVRFHEGAAGTSFQGK